MDAHALGFKTLVITDASAAVDPQTTGPAALEMMRAAGIELILSSDILAG